MKIPESFRLQKVFSRDRKGVALITVLTVMALTTILVLTFFSLASSEHRASNTYSQGLQAHQVAEQAVNLVIGQIRQATNTEPDGFESLDSRKAWASQPGAIRVWTNSGDIDGIYKLYSDDEMITLQSSEFQDDFANMERWSTLESHYVDLNEPVIRGEKVYYPIVHPAASVLPEWPKQLDDDNNGVEGFSYDSSRLDEGTFGAKAAGIAKADDGHAAMPAMWLYQLADGTIGHLDLAGSASSGHEFKRISGGGTPSEKNQIVARFAFWADDETSKLNLNVHAGGLAWDIPKAGGDLDMDMGRHQPAQKEWQRYPGHPATTHLGPALAPGIVDIVNDRDAMEMLYEVVPRVVGGGSESGTRLIDTRNPAEENGLVPDTEPLFPSLDDMIMRSDREPHEYPNADGSPIPPDELSEYLERSKFFVTAYSRAPEVNMFNLPKVATWPIYNADRSTGSRSEYQTKLTPFDRLIHYCASVGGLTSRERYDYIFRREQADSATHDYLAIQRNVEVYDYLDDLMSSSIPGYGGSFSDGDRYGDFGQDQILTMIFDYIRSSNLHDDTVFRENFAAAFPKKNTDKHDTYTNPRDGNDNNKGFGHKGHGQVTPIQINQTKGMGRFFTLAGVDIVVGVNAETGGKYSRYAGVRGYRNTVWDNRGAEKAYTNIPPWRRKGTSRPGNMGDADWETKWPRWLVNIKKTLNGTATPAERDNTTSQGEFEACFDASQWNWQLAMLDSTYRDNVIRDPGKFKYSLESLGDESGNEDTTIDTRLEEGEKLVQAVILFNLFSPSVGWISINPDMQIDITANHGMTFQNTAIPFMAFDTTPGMTIKPSDLSGKPTYRWSTNWVKPHREGGVRAWGGLLPGSFMFQARDVLGERGVRPYASNALWWQMWNKVQFRDVDGVDVPAISSPTIRSRLTPLDRGYRRIEDGLALVDPVRDINGSEADIANAYRYDLVTVPFKIGGIAGGALPLVFDGGELRFEISDAGDNSEMSYQDDGETTLVQDIEIKFDPFQFSAAQMTMAPPRRGNVNEFDDLNNDTTGVLEFASMTADPANPHAVKGVSARKKGGTWNNSSPSDNTVYTAGISAQGNSVRGRMSDAALHWNGPYIIGYHEDRNGFYTYADDRNTKTRDKSRDVDVVQSVAVPHGDIRLVAARSEIKADEIFKPHRFYGRRPMAHSLTNAIGQKRQGNYFNDSTASEEPTEFLIVPGSTLESTNPYRNAVPIAFSGESTGGDTGDFVSRNVQKFGDFDNGAGTMIDGPYINKPDEGNVHALKTKFTQEVVHYWEERRNYGEYPYFSNPEKAESGGPSYFSPNRIISGPGMFGSLPTGFLTEEASDLDTPWQTLLFRPEVLGSYYTEPHPGAKSPPDHLIMDLFWMPVIEPYAISEPLSTAGKVNLNYQMVPYLHIDRSTALRGVFRSEFMLCIPNQYHDDYKHNRGRGAGWHWRDNPFGGVLQGKRLRSVIVDSKTLEQFEERFDDGRDIFKSGTEICDIHLIPQEVAERLQRGKRGSIGTYQPSVDQMESGEYWRDHVLVGDNARERPYTNIQQRVTTKSNTFKVHYRAQVIKQSRRNSDAEYKLWKPELDSVKAEYRGSSIVERYVDPNDEELEDYAANPTASLSQHYRYRVVNPRRFAP